jgi:hypothetical protein
MSIASRLFRRHVLAAASFVCSCVIFRIFDASLPQDVKTRAQNHDVQKQEYTQKVKHKRQFSNSIKQQPPSTTPLSFASCFIQLPRQMQRCNVQAQLPRDGLPLPQFIGS